MVHYNNTIVLPPVWLHVHHTCNFCCLLLTFLIGTGDCWHMATYRAAHHFPRGSEISHCTYCVHTFYFYLVSTFIEVHITLTLPQNNSSEESEQSLVLSQNFVLSTQCVPSWHRTELIVHTTFLFWRIWTAPE